MNQEISDTKINLSPAAEGYTIKIASAWHKTIENILETARTLLEARDALLPSEWRAVRRHLDSNYILSGTTISKLLRIANSKVFSNPEYQNRLPVSYETLYLLSDKDETLLIEKINSDDIHTGLLQKEVRGLFETRPSKSDKTDNSNLTKITISGDFTQVPEDELQKLNEILNVLKSYGIEIKGI